MTNEKIFANEILSEEQLGAIAGGTVGELKDLAKAAVSNPALKNLGGFESHVPGANRILANEMEKFLKGKLSIDTDISLGFLGTGAGSKNNTYKDMTTGKSISHEEVINRLSKYAA